MMVAAIAWDNLDLVTRKRSTELVKLNPQYSSFVAEAPDDQKDKTAFVVAVTWPDLIKSTPGYKHDGERPSLAPAPTQNIGYADKYQHRYWHYKDLPFSQDGTSLIEPEQPNAQTQIETFRDTLASDASDDVKSYDLVWLLHLVGDVHQPLHATQRFTADWPNGDRGGNDVSICDPNCGTPLHSLWDEAMGPNSNPQTAIAAAAKLPDPPRSDVTITDVQVWLEESFKLAKQFVYAPPIGNGTGPFHITDAYRARATEIAEQRVALAGARLGKLLTDSLVKRDLKENLDR